MAFADNIKILRDKFGLTQQDIADIAGVTNKAVSSWESGQKEPRMGAVEKIANHFNLKKSNLIEDGGMDVVHLSHSSNFTEEEIMTLAAHQVGYEGPMTPQMLQQIKMALKIAISKSE